MLVRVSWWSTSGEGVKLLDGNGIEASEQRIKPLRSLGVGALPDESLVV